MDTYIYCQYLFDTALIEKVRGMFWFDHNNKITYIYSDKTQFSGNYSGLIEGNFVSSFSGRLKVVYE